MTKHSSRDSLVVLEASITHEDPGEIVGSNVWFVNALLDEYLTPDEIPGDALRSYYVDYYLAQVNNGGFSQFVYNSRWSPLVISLVHEGLRAIGAERHLAVFEEGSKVVEELGQDRLTSFFNSEYFGENASRDVLNAPNDLFMAAEKVEDLLILHAAWLRSHPNLFPMQSEEQMREEARRRGETLPDREARIAEARASEPRYMKLIRALCQRTGQQLDRVTAGDPTHIHEGTQTMAWHFITDRGHHHMIEAGGKAIMFRGFSNDQVGEVTVAEDC